MVATTEATALVNWLSEGYRGGQMQRFYNEPREWLAILKAIETLCLTTPMESLSSMLARNVVLLTPSKLHQNNPVAARIYALALAKLAIPTLPWDERGDIFGKAIADQDSTLALSCLEGIEVTENTLVMVSESGPMQLHHLAATGNCVPVLDALVTEYGLGIDATTEENSTPLLLAAAQGALEAVLYLLENRANIEQTNHTGLNALHLAAAIGCLPVLNALLEAGADIHALAPENATALHYAANGGHITCYERLVEAGLDPQAPTEQGFTPEFILASSRNQFATIAGDESDTDEMTGISATELAAIEILDREEEEDTLAGLRLTPPHIAAIINNANSMRAAAVEGNLRALDYKQRTPLELAAEQQSWAAFDAGVCAYLQHHPTQLAATLVANPDLATILLERLSIQDQMHDYFTTMMAKEQGEAFEEQLSDELFYQMANHFKADVIAARGVDRSDEDRWATIQNHCGWLNEITDYQYLAARPTRDPLLLGANSAEIVRELESLTPIQVADTFFNPQFVPLLLPVLHLLKPAQQKIAIPPIGPVSFLLAMQMATDELRPTFLAFATVEQAGAWAEHQNRRYWASRSMYEHELTALTAAKQTNEMKINALLRENAALADQIREASNDLTPKHFLCAISYDIMTDPVRAADGQIYDRTQIEKWLEMNPLSPYTRQPLDASDLVDLPELKAEIEAWQGE